MAGVWLVISDVAMLPLPCEQIREHLGVHSGTKHWQTRTGLHEPRLFQLPRKCYRAIASWWRSVFRPAETIRSPGDRVVSTGIARDLLFTAAKQRVFNELQPHPAICCAGWQNLPQMGRAGMGFAGQSDLLQRNPD